MRENVDDLALRRSCSLLGGECVWPQMELFRLQESRDRASMAAVGRSVFCDPTFGSLDVHLNGGGELVRRDTAFSQCGSKALVGHHHLLPYLRVVMGRREVRKTSCPSRVIFCDLRSDVFENIACVVMKSPDFLYVAFHVSTGSTGHLGAGSMRLSFRDSKGVEIDAIWAQDANDAPWQAMLLLAGCRRLEVGFVLVADDDNVPNLDEPKVQPTVTAKNLVALAGRLEARAKMIADSEPGNAMDLRLAAMLARHAVKVSWVITSVSLFT